jgi:hypothetical protein
MEAREEGVYLLQHVVLLQKAIDTLTHVLDSLVGEEVPVQTPCRRFVLV